jgi:DNA-binding beta-propeller fold protein YncE
MGVAFSADGDHVYVADCNCDRIVVFGMDGNFVHRFGTPGQAPGQLLRPAGIAVDSRSKRIYVSELGNHRISVFSSSFEFLFSFSQPGSHPDHLDRPYGLCIDDHSQRLFVADSGHHRLSVFTLDGRFVTNIEAKEWRERTPLGVAVRRKRGGGGRLAVSCVGTAEGGEGGRGNFVCVYKWR